MIEITWANSKVTRKTLKIGILHYFTNSMAGAFVIIFLASRVKVGHPIAHDCTPGQTSSISDIENEILN